MCYTLFLVHNDELQKNSYKGIYLKLEVVRLHIWKATEINLVGSLFIEMFYCLWPSGHNRYKVFPLPFLCCIVNEVSFLSFWSFNFILDQSMKLYAKDCYTVILRQVFFILLWANKIPTYCFDISVDALMLHHSYLSYKLPELCLFIISFL